MPESPVPPARGANEAALRGHPPTIEVLYFDGCPGHEQLMPRLRELLAARGVQAPISSVRVESLEDAERQRFLGSPTLRIDGIDVDPTAGERTDFGLTCRLYRTPAGQGRMPPDEWILAALERATRRDRGLTAPT